MNYIKFWTSLTIYRLTWCPVPKIVRFDGKERIFLADTGIQSATTRFRRQTWFKRFNHATRPCLHLIIVTMEGSCLPSRGWQRRMENTCPVFPYIKTDSVQQRASGKFMRDIHYWGVAPPSLFFWIVMAFVGWPLGVIVHLSGTGICVPATWAPAWALVL
jgi:hypothetical protein